MSEQVAWCAELVVLPDQLDSFIELTAEMVAETAEEPGVLTYQRFISDDERIVHAVERYENSGTALGHLRTFLDKFAERFSSAVTRRRFTVYGTPSPELKAILDGFGAIYFRPLGDLPYWARRSPASHREGRFSRQSVASMGGLSFRKNPKRRPKMAAQRVDVDGVPWTSGVPFYGPTAIFEDKEIIQIKVLSDRRAEGGGIAWLNKFSPPPGKLIKIVATALSDEHVFNLEGGRATKSGEPVRASGDYTLNPEGQPHSALIATETVSLVIYRGEPDEIVSLEVIDVAA